MDFSNASSNQRTPTSSDDESEFQPLLDRTSNIKGINTPDLASLDVPESQVPSRQPNSSVQRAASPYNQTITTGAQVMGHQNGNLSTGQQKLEVLENGKHRALPTRNHLGFLNDICVPPHLTSLREGEASSQSHGFSPQYSREARSGTIEHASNNLDTYGAVPDGQIETPTAPKHQSHSTSPILGGQHIPCSNEHEPAPSQPLSQPSVYSPDLSQTTQFLMRLESTTSKLIEAEKTVRNQAYQIGLLSAFVAHNAEKKASSWKTTPQSPTIYPTTPTPPPNSPLAMPPPPPNQSLAIPPPPPPPYSAPFRYRYDSSIIKSNEGTWNGRPLYVPCQTDSQPGAWVTVQTRLFWGIPNWWEGDRTMIDLGTAECFQRRAIERDLINHKPIEQTTFEIARYLELLTSTSELVRQYRRFFTLFGGREGSNLRDVWYNACVIIGAVGCDVQYGEWTGLITAVSFSENYLYTHLRGIGSLPHGNLDVKFGTINLPEFAILVQRTPQKIVADMITRASEYKIKSGKSC